MRRIKSVKLVLVIAILAMATTPVWAESDDQAGRLVVGAPGASTVEVGGTGSLTTLFASDNGFAGNTFDIENIGGDPVTITSWEVNLDPSGSTNTIEIYWRVGTCDGFQGNPAGWVLLGSDTGVVSAGDNNPSTVTMPPFTIQPGELFGIYVDVANFTGSTLMRYTNGGPTTFSNTELSITTYHGQGDPAFTTFFTYRQWNGTVYYDIVPVELQSFSVE